MALTKTINIDGKEVTFRASAAIPRLYRVKFHRDIYKDLDALQKAMDGSDEKASTLDTFPEMSKNTPCSTPTAYREVPADSFVRARLFCR